MSKMLSRIFIIIALALPSVSYAAPDVMKVSRWYKIYWNRTYVADLKVGLKGNTIVSRIDSKGLAKTISKYSNHAESKFNYKKGVYIPSLFRLDLKQRQGNKNILIKYSANGRVIKETVIPPDKRYKRPAVDEAKKIGAVDTLTAILVTRDKIKAALLDGSKNFSFNIYEGRRLLKLDFEIYGTEKIKVLEKNMNVLKIGFKRIPLEGFTNNELKRMKGEEPDFIVYLEEGSLLPVKADAAAPLGAAVFVLEKECELIEQCN